MTSSDIPRPGWAKAAGALLAPLLAAWLGATLAVWWMATGTFQVLSADRNPAIAQRLDPLEPPRREAFLRHAAGEVNRHMFRGWTRAQLVLGALMLLAAWAGGAPSGSAGGRRWLPAGLVLLAGIAAVQGFWLSPEIERLGILLDRAREAATLRRFGFLHAAYRVSDLAKVVLLTGGLWLVRKGER